MTPSDHGQIAAYSFEQLERPSGAMPTSAADVLSIAWAEADEVREQARMAGEGAGRTEGLAAARADCELALAALASAVRSLEGTRSELVAALERDAAELAIRLSEQILAGVLSVQPERVLDVTRGALLRLADRDRVTVVVNPADLALLRESVGSLQDELGGIGHLAVQSDDRIARGGAIARTESGEIDADLNAQLERAREVVAAALSEDGIDAG
jgi:flagellar assembly protein FliH